MAVNWTQLSPAHAPSARARATIGLDLNTGNNILFGGAATSGAGYSTPGETWEWDGADWTQLSPATTPTPAAGRVFQNGDMAWDGINNKLMMVLTERNITPESLRFFHWDAGDWTEVFFAYTFPGPSGGVAYESVLSWNPTLNKVLLFASNNSEIYEWDGTDWSGTGNFPSITGGYTSIAFNGGWTYDPIFDATVYYGGIASLGVFAYDTVLYDGAWTNVAYTPASPPSNRFTQRYTAYLGCAEGVVIYGYNNAPSYDTLILRNNGGTYTWDDLAPATHPTNASFGSLCETKTGKILYFGGFESGVAYDETWRLSCRRRSQQIRWR